ncbi:Gfo/Idh/MocA family protein [Anatilimnocola sp. NA78]|uniref:Gfo/Idh/MocA family protein n=1 Tax=Anatilimnocola sp. NA78 TaxID=3415683 RepID=UPI003CE4C12D
MTEVSRRTFSLSIASGIALAGLPAVAQDQKELKVGIIGLDTSHVMAFTKELNNPKATEDVAHCRVIAAYPQGSPDIESSTSRVPGYTKDIQTHGVEIVDSIDELVKRVDCILLETNDGRPHLEQALAGFKAGKPTFIDKPVAGSLADAIAIYQAAKIYKAPVFSCSSLRFAKGAQEIRGGAIGDIQGCDAYSPCSLEKTHPELFWYGIHGVETLFTVMGSGCESVSRVSTNDYDLAAGVWSGGRIGTFRGIRSKGGSGYGGTAFGSKGIREIGKFDGYRPLAVEIVKFFRGGQPPVSAEETLQIYAFMEAADESKRQGGKPVTLESVMKKAEGEAAARLATLGVK